MPPTLNFDTFELEAEFDSGLSLDEAIQRAEALRRDHPELVYRIRPRAEDPFLFRVEEKTLDEVQTEHLDNLSKRLSGLLSLWRKRRA